VRSKASLIYRTETTTKKWKTKKTQKVKKQIRSEVSVNSPGNPCSQSRRRKEKLRLEGFAEKEGNSWTATNDITCRQVRARVLVSMLKRVSNYGFVIIIIIFLYLR